MKKTSSFCSFDRYVFDFKLCSVHQGYSQVDTDQDASYYGTWANPFELKTVNYAEGDVTICEFDNDHEFVEGMIKLKQWNEDNGFRFIGIDTMCNDKMTARFKELGLSELLH